MPPSPSPATAASGVRADAVVDEADRPADDLRHRRRDRRQRHFRHALALRPLEMGEQRHLGAPVGKLADGRRDALDAGRVGDRAVLRPARSGRRAGARACPEVAGVVERAEGGHEDLSSAHRAAETAGRTGPSSMAISASKEPSASSKWKRAGSSRAV